MMEPKILTLNKPKPTGYDKLEEAYKKRHEAKIMNLNTKVDAKVNYVNDKLEEIIKETLECVDSAKNADEIKLYLEAGEKHWKRFASIVRMSNKYIKVDSDAFEKQIQTLIYKADDINTAKDNFVKRFNFANKNVITRVWYRIISFFKNLGK